ncbi:MAG TPA: hypothetical protein PKK26_13260, partial [Candidatus Wallbacteria bacterium]|nr:hypothetical protein [Candidatus Wallbacteria bacterium]
MQKKLILAVLLLAVFICPAFTQTPTQTLALKKGFNFISFTITPTITAQDLINLGADEIYSYGASAGSFTSFSERTLPPLAAGRGYIIKTSAPGNIMVPGTAAGSIGNIDLKAGFNLMGVSKEAGTAKFSDTVRNSQIINGLYKWNAASGSFIIVRKNASNMTEALDGIDPSFTTGQSYFVNLTVATTLNYDNGSLIFGADTGTTAASGAKFIEIRGTIANSTSNTATQPTQMSAYQGGTIPPGGTIPGGTIPGGTIPGGTIPGGTIPGGTTPIEINPTGTNPTGTITQPQNIDYMSKGYAISACDINGQPIPNSTVSFTGTNTFNAVFILEKEFKRFIILNVKEPGGKTIHKYLLGRLPLYNESQIPRIFVSGIYMNEENTARTLLTLEDKTRVPDFPIAITQLTLATGEKTDFDKLCESRLSNVSRITEIKNMLVTVVKVMTYDIPTGGNTPTGTTPTGTTPTGTIPTGTMPTGTTPTGAQTGGMATLKASLVSIEDITSALSNYVAISKFFGSDETLKQFLGQQPPTVTIGGLQIGSTTEVSTISQTVNTIKTEFNNNGTVVSALIMHNSDITVYPGDVIDLTKIKFDLKYFDNTTKELGLVSDLESAKPHLIWKTLDDKIYASKTYTVNSTAGGSTYTLAASYMTEAGYEHKAYLIMTVKYTTDSSATATIGSTGATIQLFGGTSLKIPAGTAAGASVTFSMITDNKRLNNSPAQAFSIKSSAALTGAKIWLPVDDYVQSEKNIKAGIYNPNSNSFSTTSVTVDSANKLAIIDLGQQIAAPSAGVARSVTDEKLSMICFAEKIKPVSVTAKRKVLAVPYYQQSGGSCWATDILMFLKAFHQADYVNTTYKVLQRAGIETDAGTGWGESFTGLENWITRNGENSTDTYVRTIANISTMQTQAVSWFFMETLQQDTIKIIDSGSPIIMDFGKHAMLIIGYDLKSSGEFHFIINNSGYDGSQNYSKFIQA